MKWTVITTALLLGIINIGLGIPVSNRSLYKRVQDVVTRSDTGMSH